MLGTGSLCGKPQPPARGVDSRTSLHRRDLVWGLGHPCRDSDLRGGLCEGGTGLLARLSVMFLVEFIGTWGSAARARAALAARPHLPGSEFTLRCFARPSKSALRGGTILLACHPPTSGLFLFLSRIVSPSACTYVCLHYPGYELLRTLEAGWSLCVVSRGAGQFLYTRTSPCDRLTGLTCSSHSGRREVDSRGFEVRVPDDR